MKYGCIGEKLSHSFSKEIHNLIADYDYNLTEIEKDALPGFMTAADFEAINVTIPYKEAVIPFLDVIDEHARKIGAVNTIVKREGKLYGYNTDFYGMIALISKLGISVLQKKAAILGSGGTSKTAMAVLTHLGAREILTVSRNKGVGKIDYNELYEKHSDVEIIINTTPVGMFPKNNDLPISLGKLTKLDGVIDVIYNPIKSSLILEAEKRGIPTLGGLYMLVMQAVYAAQLFTDNKIDVKKADEIYKKMLRDKTNIVLTGMPSSGKSTVGSMLARDLNREFIDTDNLIEKRAGKSIPDIFRENGEPVFRQIEAEVILDCSKKCGAVIATGGGAVLNEDNVQALRQNGRIYFIDRPLNLLFPTDTRPLSSDRNTLTRLYKNRHGLYENTADVIIDAVGNEKDIADKIREDYYQ